MIIIKIKNKPLIFNVMAKLYRFRVNNLMRIVLKIPRLTVISMDTKKNISTFKKSNLLNLLIVLFLLKFDTIVLYI